MVQCVVLYNNKGERLFTYSVLIHFKPYLKIVSTGKNTRNTQFNKNVKPSQFLSLKLFLIRCTTNTFLVEIKKNVYTTCHLQLYQATAVWLNWIEEFDSN